MLDEAFRADDNEDGEISKDEWLDHVQNNAAIRNLLLSVNWV